MKMNFTKTAVAAVIAVLFFNTSPSAAADQCMVDFASVQKAYSKSNFEATVIDSASLNVEPFSLDHASVNGISYSTWKTLNNEVEGYALRNGKGFDFNHSQSFIGILSWHQTLIWDKLFSDKTRLEGYECTMLGRTRLAGRLVAMMRLSPVDEMRYSFVVARDEDTSLPVELAVVSPKQIVRAKFTVTAVHAGSSDKYSLTDETFDRVEKLSPKRVSSSSMVWRELTIPSNFKIKATSTQKFPDGKNISYQEFSDGLVSFRVYRNTKTAVSVPTATDGTLTVFRAAKDNYEYAVVGEIPLELSMLVLSKILPK